MTFRGLFRGNLRLRGLGRLGNTGGGRGRDGRTRGIEDNTFRPFLIGMNPYDGKIGGRLGLLRRRWGRQTDVGDQQKRKQRAANVHKITHQRHLPYSIRNPQRCDLPAQPAINVFVPGGEKRFDPEKIRRGTGLSRAGTVYTWLAATGAHFALAAFTLTKPTCSRTKVFRLFMLMISEITRERSVRWLPSGREKAQAISTSLTA